ncbi:ATP-dependent DNA helicase RecG [Tepiditoga spiralis]|uniref:ATP-dependent DNA helicase RecG n=1 Tax=Tepiditoga spiralis TaxID=2108365 RepID=A0A7G1G9N1_9BACT|nr:ATP-dependent DNA helicase RecG [Tepiditoga spiralis]BBE31954.1 ATP-dependent DNA helicase RecG [Tepiditoga spiralis]
MMHIEEILNEYEYILDLKEKNIKKWEEIFPAFYSISKINTKTLKDNNMLEDIKKLLGYVKPLAVLPEERKIKRFKELKTALNKLKNKYLIDSFEKPEKKINLFTDIKFLKHVGEKRANSLRNIGLSNLYTTFFYLPRDYEDRRKIKKIINTKDGEFSLISGKIVNFEELRINKGLTIINYSVEDSTGVIILSFFNQKFVKDKLKRGLEFAFYGKVEYSYGRRQMKSPEFFEISSLKKEILPIYPLTNGISQQVIRKIFKQTIPQVYYYEEYIPKPLIEKYSILNINERIKGIHFPKSFYHKKLAYESMKYEEIILFESALLLSKKSSKQKKFGISKKISGELLKKYLKILPFKPTEAQIRSHNEIRKDLISKSPMNRMLQGDVGSGKTVVSEFAIIDNFEAGYQSAMMVPTSVLAKQQFLKIQKNLKNIGINVALLLGETKNKEKKEIKEKLANGKIDLIIGTHALIQDDVVFSKLGLIIIDEQHRFGVNQRLKLINKGISPDILVMTATPIPRTLALTIYGDLDISIIDQMPKGRKKVKTVLSTDSNLKNIYRFIHQEIDQGNQAFFIYPLVEESEVLDLKAAKDMYEKLKLEFNNVALLHGKMKSEEKNNIMEKFSSKEISILVSTTVVEVGVDIPDATVIVIEHADRFGLSQLHQLRGRVGRSKKQSYCFLITGNNIPETTKNKLFEFSNTFDGFKVSEIDLSWRGPGKFFGTQQHGIHEFKFTDIVEDMLLLDKIRKELESNQESYFDEKLKKEILKRYGKKLNLINAI